MSGNGDYISREAAIKARGRSCDRDCAKCDFAIDGDSWCEGEVFVVDLLRVPAADVRPVVHGKWIWFGDCSNEGLYCSVCKNKIHEVRKPKKKLSNFCPNCGADMMPPKEGE